MRYTITIPMTTHYVATVEADSPEAAIAQALDDFDPNNPRHLPPTTDEMGFSLDPKGAKAEHYDDDDDCVAPEDLNDYFDFTD